MLSHILTTTYTSTDGNSHTITQLITKNDGYGNTTICNTNSSGTTGTITCIIPAQYQNNSFWLQTSSDGVLLGSSLFTQGEDPEFYGADVLIELFMFTSLVMMMLGHPILIVIGGLLGFVMAIALLFMAGQSFSAVISSVIFFVVGGIIIIWQISKKI